jgi:hypothetical protein
MTERIARQQVTFAQPFFVGGLGREQPAGTYEVEIVEEQIEGISHTAHRLLATSIKLPLPGGGRHSYQLVPMERSLVRAAMQEDQRLGGAAPDPCGEAS